MKKYNLKELEKILEKEKSENLLSAQAYEAVAEIIKIKPKDFTRKNQYEVAQVIIENDTEYQASVYLTIKGVYKTLCNEEDFECLFDVLNIEIEHSKTFKQYLSLVEAKIREE